LVSDTTRRKGKSGGHAKSFFDFHLIGFHKSKASFLDFWAKEKDTDFFSV